MFYRTRTIARSTTCTWSNESVTTATCIELKHTGTYSAVIHSNTLRPEEKDRKCCLRNFIAVTSATTGWPTPFSVAVSVCRDQWCVFCTPSLAVFSTRCNQLDSNLANLEATVEVGHIPQLNGTTCAIKTSSFTRQCRDIIQVRWKMSTWFYGKFIQKYHIKFHLNLPSFTENITKKTSDLFFSGQSVLTMKNW